jgi:GTPase SAR1 family protein
MDIPHGEFGVGKTTLVKRFFRNDAKAGVPQFVGI